MKGLRTLGLLVLVTTAMSPGATMAQTAPLDSASGGAALVGELGCAACHVGLGARMATIRDWAPSLAHAGERFHPGYVFAYLMDPQRVLRHIGASRMPDFGLTERESLALTLYLQTRIADAGRAIPTEVTADGRVRVSNDNAIRAITDLGCTGCHTLDGSGGALGPDLTLAGQRLTEDFLRRHLAAPDAFDSTTTMPSLFFSWTGGTARGRVADATDQLRQVAAYLSARGEDERRDQARALDRVRDDNPDVTAALGERIATALNCAACHGGLGDPRIGAAPSLDAARFEEGWLRGFLASPYAVRPAGHRTGSRMPDFRLSGAEVEAIVSVLRGVATTNTPDFVASPLTAFSSDKARRYVRDRYPCLGCHQLDGEGGRIGPDLSRVGDRLTANAIYTMIVAPQRGAPGSVMPQMLMPEDRTILLANFLAAQRGVSQPEPYLSLVENPPGGDDGSLMQGAGLYARYCAMCHGDAGQGDGYNAGFLPVTPTRHADGAYMATRPDDTLFDGIHVGGLILNRSHRMPGFGQLLSTQQIRALVAYMRELCGCQGPSWTRNEDG